MSPEELATAKRHHDIEMTVSTIAYVLAVTESWDADTLETIADLIGKVAPHPGDVKPGNDDTNDDTDDDTDDDSDDPQPGGYEQYVNALMAAQLPVSWGMIAEAQALDAEANDDTDHTPMFDHSNDDDTPTCDRHGGPWGHDETCEQCTDENGTPRTHDDDTEKDNDNV